MSDEVFRQERKPINRKEIMPEIEETQEKHSHVPMPKVREMNKPDSPLKVSGLNNNNPLAQKFLNAINNTTDADEDSGDYQVRESRMKTVRKNVSPQQDLRATGSQTLENLIEGIKESTNVYEKITLPSLGKFYDGSDGPRDGVLHIRPMTGEEEQILATPRFVKKGVAINMIFNRCIKEKFNSENFLSVDRTFLLIWLRGISYSPEYDVEVTCPFTDKKFQYTIDLNLPVDECPPNYTSASLEDVMPITGYKFKYRLATGADEQRVQDYRDQKSKFDQTNQSDDTLMYRTALLLEEIEGLTDKRELQILLRKLPIGDVSHIRNKTSEPPFGTNTKVTIISPFNMEEFEIDLPLEANFFFPKQRKTQT